MISKSGKQEHGKDDRPRIIIKKVKKHHGGHHGGHHLAPRRHDHPFTQAAMLVPVGCAAIPSAFRGT